VRAPIPVAALGALATVITLGGLAGCVDRKDGISGTQSIGVELVSPASPGDPQNRLSDTVRSITINLTAYDADGAADPSFDRDVQVYVQFLGTLTPTLRDKDPLATIRMTAGKAVSKTIALPAVYGPTTLWIDDGKHPEPTYATGTSPTLWFRDPFIADVQTPSDERMDEAMYVSPLQNKQITVNSSRYGALGKLVVTSVFAQGYTVSDVACADATGAPPCVARAYDHIEVFSFSAPRDQNGRPVEQGQVIDGFSGGIAEFNGLTEIGFPATFTSKTDIVPGRVPAPAKLDKDNWFKSITDPQGIINFERNEAGPIEIENARVCNLDNDYITFKQWKLDTTGVGGNCPRSRPVLNVITAGVIADLDPATLVGKVVPRVVGVLRPVQLPGFNVWIIFPRNAADLTLPP
jgi:hypothetical protein